MTKDEFRKFVEAKHKTNKPIDEDFWPKQKDEFLEYIDQLYSKINEYLKEFVASDQISIASKNVIIEEPDTGRYEVPKLDINIGDKNVSITPIGTQLIGCKGRIDLSSMSGSIKIVLVSSEMKSLRDHIKVSVTVQGETTPKEVAPKARETINWKWRLLSSPPTSHYIEFNEENFLEALMELANG